VSEVALRRVLERVAPSVRASVVAGSFVASSYATPLALAALALEEELLIAVTATSTEAEHVRDALAAWLGRATWRCGPGGTLIPSNA